MPRLMPPSMTYATSYLEALHEGHTDTTDAHLQVPVDVVAADLAGHIAGLNRPAQTIRLPDGREIAAVPSVHLWLIAGGDFIGRVSVRYACSVPAATSATASGQAAAGKALDDRRWCWQRSTAGSAA